MAMNSTLMAAQIATGLGQPGPTPELESLSDAIITYLIEDPIVNPTTGKILGVVGSDLADLMVDLDPSTFPFVSTELGAICEGIALDLTVNAVAAVNPTIPAQPAPVSGASGGAMAAFAISAGMTPAPLLTGFMGGIADHINSNAIAILGKLT